VSTTLVPEQMDASQLDSWLEVCGVGRKFIEFSGNIKVIPPEHRWHILQAMGEAPVSAADLEARTAELERKRHTGMPPVLLIDHTNPTVDLWLSEPDLQTPCYWQLTGENGELQQGQGIPATWQHEQTFTFNNPEGEQSVPATHCARRLHLPHLTPGYHTLSVSHRGSTWQSLLIAAPAQAWQTGKLQAGSRCWGISVQLYTLRTTLNCGIGDFGDLARLVTLCSEQGTDFIQLNPLHALDPRYPDNASPYSPGDRRFLNPLYITPLTCPGFDSVLVQARWTSAAFQQLLNAARESDEVQYSRVSRLKYQIFELLYQWARKELKKDAVLDAEFTAYVAAQGVSLQQFCEFQAALAPAGSVQAESEFQTYLQWLAWRQLQACQQQAIDTGMSIGLIRDLAVGSSVDGCEVQCNLDQFCLDARIGAPPDNFNPDGQNWGLPPMLPGAMFSNRFQLFRDLLSSNMTNCGALRIDHVLGYYRLWWCPNDGSNTTGTYVHFPADILFAILRLESHRHSCLVIGEDLGVVPPEIRGYLENGGIYSNCVFYFEKYDEWHFRKPEHYKQQALTMQANHDVAPLTAWWNASDLQLRLSLGLIPDADKLEQELEWRKGERGSLLQWLDEQGLLPDSWQSRPLDRPLDDEMRLALTRAIARVSSALLSLQLDDLAQVELPVNIPGTSTEYANWRRKLPVELEAIFARPFVRQLLQEVNEAR